MLFAMVLALAIGCIALILAWAWLTPREREVLALMAEGRSNVAIAQRLFITEKAVSKHAAGIFAKLDLVPSDDDNRRVLAVLAYLDS
jgi:DNA-binding CsgD family transcriptional regulator